MRSSRPSAETQPPVGEGPVTTRRRALLLTAPGTFARGEIEGTTVRGGSVPVRIQYTGLCGTDLHIVAGDHPRATFPLALGHELVGRALDGQDAGRLVVVDPLVSCGQCEPCRHGRPHVCERLRLIGIDTPGGLAGVVEVVPDRLHVVPEGVEPANAALAEPLAVAVHAVRRSAVGPDSVVVIFGAGPIGLLTALVARQSGPRHIFVAERSTTRRETAASFGLEVLDDRDPLDDLSTRTEGAMADVAFDAAAVAPVASLLPRAVRPGGTIALVGVYGDPVPVDLQAVVFRELTIVGNRVYSPDDVDDALELIASGSIDPRPLITDIVPVDATPDVLTRLAAGDGIKYLVDCESVG